ncbi:hypothetical protein ILUMI_19707 [Ignelater luminosus]|uniref:Reverse transcriptase domain-containing protein n=1 Tax=Ignelater luminosus TaxID=2038154 RepID=A0A8K0CJY9_IGNLU|nr:hypothetical protein ILUMI_19707 [Ignelater luminosus]
MRHYNTLLSEYRDEYKIPDAECIHIQGEKVTVTEDVVKTAVKALKKTELVAQKFADDQVIIANGREHREYMVRILIEEFHKWGLVVNTKKTKCLCIGTEQENLTIGNNKEIGVCDEYKYLGTIFNREGTVDRETNSRIIKARKAITCLNGILWGKTSQRKESTIYYMRI